MIRRRGYTLIEVMTALAVLTVGAAGVIAMQKSTQIGNHNARMLSTATEIASTWVERLRVDAVQWNNPGGTDDLATDTIWLKNVSTSANVFLKPDAVVGMASPVADIHGTDIFPGDSTTAAFCTHVAFFPLYPGTIGVTVRTVWLRSGSIPTQGGEPDCDPLRYDSTTYGAVYFTTAVYNNVTPGG